jgi:N,N-dimethylformamidase beta subunit-like, C-terminal/RTX calcium-binding nonapeptide repeat (4 copies)
MAHPWRRRCAWTFSTAVLLLALTVGSAAAERVSGTSRGETIRGTSGADTLLGRAGDDRIFGLAGADVVTGGRGMDRLWGGPGSDRLVARDGARDLVICGPGRDTAVVDLHDLVHGSCEAVRRPTSTTVAPPPPSSPPPVVAENEKPGTPGWAAFQLAPVRAIEGYTDPSAAPGDILEFHVSTLSDERYRILVYRVGYYGGIGARRVACLPSCDEAAEGHERATSTASPEGLVHAGWPVSLSLEIPVDWVSGYYFAHFQLASGPYAGRVTTTWFLVREGPGIRRAPILVQGSPTTWQAYNGWGGGSLYEFNSPGGRRAAKIAFDRPYDQPLEQRPEALEVPLARFLERNGYDVAYQADVDTARYPGSLANRRVVAVAGHSEYWSRQIRDAFETARAAGVDLAFFGANAAYWQVRYEDDFRTIVGYKSAAWDPETDPTLESTLFRALIPPRYECSLMGIQHAGGTLEWTTDGDYTVTEDAERDPWMKRAGLVPGDVVRGVVSREVDTIPGAQSAQSSCGNALTVLFHRELGTTESGDADAIRFTAASGAKVFASGSHQFVWGLEDVPEVERMRHGIVDPKLQAFVRAMLDDMLGTG